MRLLKILSLSLVLGLCILTNGCIVTSLHPLYTDNDLVFNEKLAGTWKDEKDDETWLFSLNEKEKSYKLTIFDDESAGNFTACLVSINGCSFLDLYPEEKGDAAKGTGNLWYYLHLLPMHSFLKVSIEGDSLRLGIMEIDWFNKKIENGVDIGVKYEISDDDRCILTDSTEKLQEFMIWHVRDTDLFEESVLYRLKENK